MGVLTLLIYQSITVNTIAREGTVVLRQGSRKLLTYLVLVLPLTETGVLGGIGVLVQFRAVGVLKLEVEPVVILLQLMEGLIALGQHQTLSLAILTVVVLMNIIPMVRILGLPLTPVL